MKAWSRVVAALVLALSMILTTTPQARPLASATSNTPPSALESIKDLQGNSKGPFNLAGSSFRSIPRSGSNPIQNKLSPP